MTKVITQHDLLTSKYTRIYNEPNQKFNAPHHFFVIKSECLDIAHGLTDEMINNNPDWIVGQIDFQEGPIKENGVNGVCNEDLIVMVIKRLEGFQNSEYRCRENAVAITKLEEALMWLRKRTNARIVRGVEGTSQA